jgi:chromatin remodeling complex protein RSC6
MSSTNVSATSMMNNSTASKKVAKKVAEKVAEPVAAAPAPVVAAKEVKEKKTKTAVVEAVVAPVVTTTATTTETTETNTENTVTLADEIKALHDQLTTIREAASSALSALKRIQKKASQDIKEAGKKKRRSRSENADGEPRKPSNFEIPIPISDELSLFLGGGKNNKMSRSQVTKAVNKYLNEKGLRTKHSINPDAALIKLLGVDKNTELTLFNIQTYLNRHYIKPTATA